VTYGAFYLSKRQASQSTNHQRFCSPSSRTKSSSPARKLSCSCAYPQKDLLISPTQISVYVCGVDPNILRHPVLQADWDRAFVLPPTETLFISVLVRHNHQTVARLSRASSDVRLQPIPPAAEDLAPNKSSLRADGARGSHYGFVASGGSYRQCPPKRAVQVSASLWNKALPALQGCSPILTQLCADTTSPMHLLIRTPASPPHLPFPQRPRKMARIKTLTSNQPSPPPRSRPPTRHSQPSAN
jgi:hypothetical protein